MRNTTLTITASHELLLHDADGDRLQVMPATAESRQGQLYLEALNGVYLTREDALQVLDHLAGWLYATSTPTEQDACPVMGETAPDATADGYGWPDVHGTAPASVALEAHAAVHGDRQGDYGHPREDFTRTAILWTGLLQHKLADGEFIDADDIARCMIGVKLSRDVHAPKRDNRVDIAGYAITLDRLETGL